jgi:glycosyltransferase involved in cell wall biosynthesis
MFFNHLHPRLRSHDLSDPHSDQPHVPTATQTAHDAAPGGAIPPGPAASASAASAIDAGERRRLRICFDVSQFGQAYHRSSSRCGIFRVVSNVVDEALRRDWLDVQVVASASARDEWLTCAYCRHENRRLRDRFHPLRRTALPDGLLAELHRYARLGSGLGQRISKASAQFACSLLRPCRPTLHCDIYHSFYDALPDRNWIDAGARVITIHDMLPILHPDWFQSHVPAFFERIIASIDPQRDWAICVSECTRQDFCRISGLPPERTCVIPLAAGVHLHAVRDPRAQQQVRARYRLPDGPFLLCLSALEPRKNLPRVMRAFAGLCTDHPELHLVLAGPVGWKTEEIGRCMERHPILHNRVIQTGFVDEGDLPGLFSAASAFLYPSLYEGFGLPPLEAMACGAVVITSNRSSIPEVVGDAAMLVDPEDTHALQQAMRRVLEDQDFASELSRRALLRSRHFSWERNLREHLAFYRQICAA